MPTYTYLCEVHNEFEETHSIKMKLEFCPHCKEDGKETPIKRLISLNGKGVVELTGQELIDKLKSDSKQLQKDAAKNEYKYSNLLGENTYSKLVNRFDRNKK